MPLLDALSAWAVPRSAQEVPILTAVSFTVALGYGIAAPAIPAQLII